MESAIWKDEKGEGRQVITDVVIPGDIPVLREFVEREQKDGALIAFFLVTSDMLLMLIENSLELKRLKEVKR